MVFRLIFLLAGLAPALAHSAEWRALKIPIDLGQGKSTMATLSLPEAAGGEKLPTLLVFGGFERAGEVLSLLYPATTARVAFASFDYPFTAPRRIEFPKSLRSLPEAKALYPSTVRGILSLLSELKRRPELDPARIVLIGASFGAPFALGAAARSPDA